MAAKPGRVSGQVLACPACETSAGPFEPAEARLLADRHDQIHHGGTPTAQVSGGGPCESCRTRAATLVWHHPPAGAPFQLCEICAAAPVPQIPAPAAPSGARA